MNPLLQLLEHGQSYWLDNLTRGKIRSGELERRVKEEGLRGVTSNPAIFQKAISRSRDYDEEIERLVGEGLSVSQVYERLTVSDIRAACDVLRPVYDGSGGTDGFVSLEVSPHLAHDTEGSLEEARRLFRAVDRPNCFIKIPGTPAGVPAIEEALFEGININITLLFSIRSYEAVAEAYLRSLERRRDAGLPVDDVASVASFFLSRIDVLVDQLLGHRILPGSRKAGPRPEELLGRAAIANAKLAYRSFKRIVESTRWRALEEEGAHVQRMLWASTSTKDPLYGDVRYVEPLIGPHTVNTLPDETIEAFADHGRVATTVEDGVQEARDVMDGLAELGIDFDFVTRQLLNEGVQKFMDPFDQLMATLAARCHALRGGCVAGLELGLGDLEGTVRSGLAALHARRFGRRLFARDPHLWSADPEEAEAIRNRLGWLESPEAFRGRIGEILAFAREARDAGFRHVVLLGMGGSSLTAEVCRRSYGSADGWPALRVLDETDPEAVLAAGREIDLTRTLFLVASKSGTTAETLALYRHFFHEAKNALDGDPGGHFVAITDPGTPLAEEAREKGFRRTFENPEEIGGRYSALSYFGLVPMALVGMDVETLLDRAIAMLRSSDPFVPAVENPGLRLGAALGVAGRAGRDKVTFVPSAALEPFGMWAEQLLAESTGKEGRGLLPVVGEPLHGEETQLRNGYGPDRLFVGLWTRGEEAEPKAFLEAREKEGHPVVRIELDGLLDLGAEFLRWELATAATGAILGINPFDEPNVAESKENTHRLLEEWRERSGFPEPEPAARDERLAVFPAPGQAPEGEVVGSPAGSLREFLSRVEPGDYVALLPFFRQTPERHELLARARAFVGRRGRVATSLGYGPRYLHSTGQLFKGGPATGHFLLLTANPGADVPIPGEAYGFAGLLRAQALGDFQALAEGGRRVLRIHLTGPVEEALGHLAGTLEAALEAAPAEIA